MNRIEQGFVVALLRSIGFFFRTEGEKDYKRAPAHTDIRS
jgi:hypothetical protein